MMHCHSESVQVMVPSAVLLASLIGSGHCALMCGGLVVSAARSFWQNFFYHAGRLLSYTLLGAVSGWLGGNMIYRLPPQFSEIIAWLIALSFVVLGVFGWKNNSWHLYYPGTEILNQWLAGLMKRLTDSKQPGRIYYAAAVGFLSVFLPCGWLYSFVLASVSVGSPWKSAAFMGVFWAGTLPALMISPVVLRGIFSFAQNYTPKISAMLLIAAGIIPILFRYIRL